MPSGSLYCIAIVPTDVSEIISHPSSGFLGWQVPPLCYRGNTVYQLLHRGKLYGRSALFSGTLSRRYQLQLASAALYLAVIVRIDVSENILPPFSGFFWVIGFHSCVTVADSDLELAVRLLKHGQLATYPPTINRLSRQCGNLDFSQLNRPPRPVSEIA
jgi:hypothetical protein